MQYRVDEKRDLRQIAGALGVANVLEGTVRRNGNRVRVSIELIDAHRHFRHPERSSSDRRHQTGRNAFSRRKAKYRKETNRES